VARPAEEASSPHGATGRLPWAESNTAPGLPVVSESTCTRANHGSALRRQSAHGAYGNT
jgi:hypothetical protein